MMAPEAEDDGGRDAQRKADEQLNAKQEDNQQPHGDVETQRPRDRRQSDAERRDEREQQRATQQQTKTRLSLLNNRFLTRKDSRSASPKRKAAAEEHPEDDGPEAEEEEEENEEKEERSKRSESVLVVTRKRSSAASSTVKELPTNARERQQSSAAAASRPRAGVSREELITTPSRHVVPSLVLKRSKWTRELDEDANSGLFVADAREELSQIASSTLVRLEERLQRDFQSTNKENDAKGSIRLNELLHSVRCETEDESRGDNQLMDTVAHAEQRAHSHKAPAPTTAALEITVDRLVLDDHACFSLADRIETQLKSLHASYTQLVVSQPWLPLRQRVDAFVDARLRASAAPSDLQWLKQTQADAQSLLLALGTLQQLHYQLLITWHELQDCYRQPASAARTQTLRIQVEKRAESLSLSSLQAFLELDDTKNQAETVDEDEDEATSKLRKRLDGLEIKDQHLHVVLRLEAFTADVTPTTSPPLGAYNGNAWSRLSACWSHMSVSPPPPQFYVVLFINDKEVGRTRAVSWSSPSASTGSVVLRETLRTQLQFFPDSVTVKVFERGLLMDTLVSTTAIPLLVPGHDLVHSGRRGGGGGGRGGRGDRDLVAAASLAPSSEWYQFSSVKAIARGNWHATFLNSAQFAKFERHPNGRVRVHVAWVPPASSVSLLSSLSSGEPHGDGDDGELPTAVVLPPRRAFVAAKGNTKLVGPRVDRRPKTDSDERVTGSRSRLRAAGFSYERDFLVHMDDLVAVDRNDPQNASVVKLQDHTRAQSTLLRQRDVFRASALTYDALLPLARATIAGRAATLTKRNYLLQLRDREHVAKHGTSMIVGDSADSPQGKRWDHAVFEDPLPLSEHEIATNTKFLSLLRPEIPSFDQQQRLDDALAAGGDSRVSLELQRKLQQLKIRDFVDRVRASHLVRVHNATGHAASAQQQRDRAKTLASIIQEQPLPLQPGALDLSGLSGLFSRRRRLRPRVERRSAPQTMADWPRHCTLYVQIKGASNVPVRIKTRRPVGGVTAKKKPALKRGGAGGGGATTDEEDEEEKPSSKRETVDNGHVFVEISFQGKRRRTTSTHVRTTGAVWMETVALPFHAPLDDWSPDSLQKTPDVVRFSLFDQLVRASPSHADDDALLLQRSGDQPASQQQQRMQSFHQENSFLGSLEIPFTTLYHNHGTLDATLRCEMPVVNAGYANAKHSTGSGDDTADDTLATVSAPGVPPSASAASATSVDDEGVLQSSREATFLSVMLTLDPLLPQPVPAFQEVHALGDDAALAAYAKQWADTTQNLNTATRRRDFHVFVRNLSHGQTFLTRYLLPQTPPPPPMGKTWTVQQLVRFVHLVPFLDDWNLFEGQGGAGDDGELDVWTTSQELLELNAGDEEEHAVLLCNFLNWLDRQEPNRRSFLVLADGVPQGKTVYVLRQDSYKIPQRSVLWQASAGVGYSVLDDRCPVLDVSLVVSSDNIYANIQPKKRLSEMNWDVESNAKAWKPFFHGTVKKEQFTLLSVQIKELQYAETPPEFVQQVELEIRETIKLEIRRWRSSKYTTTFNMDLSMKLRGQLGKLEIASMQRGGGGATANKVSTTKNNESDPIQELLRTRRVSGLPLHTSFTDVQKVVAMVQNTHIYWNDHAEVEFGLAVYVHAYPNCILSVWVYLVAVEPLDN